MGADHDSLWLHYTLLAKHRQQPLESQRIPSTDSLSSLAKLQKSIYNLVV